MICSQLRKGITDMQLKRDTDYALRIMICTAKHIQKNNYDKGVLKTDIATDTGIPKPAFNRICSRLEEKGMLYTATGAKGEKLLFPGVDFWQQSILTIGEAVEGNMKVFILFDKNASPAPYYKESLTKAQKNLEDVLSDATLESMLETADASKTVSS